MLVCLAFRFATVVSLQETVANAIVAAVELVSPSSGVM